jgi:RNA polymerase sigma-70 factor (ECF subfamily)
MDTDEILWKGLQTGDKLMFLGLYRKYYHDLLFYGLKRVADIQLVKDVIQQQFVYLWEKRESLGEAKNVRSYLISSFLRRLIKDWVRNGKTTNLEVAWCNLPDEFINSPEEMLIAKFDREHVRKKLMYYIHLLPARQKELMMMKFYEGLSYDTIVLRTGLTHRTVYNKIHEAVETLRKKFQKSEESQYMAYSFIAALMLVHELEHLPNI